MNELELYILILSKGFNKEEIENLLQIKDPNRSFFLLNRDYQTLSNKMSQIHYWSLVYELELLKEKIRERIIEKGIYPVFLSVFLLFCTILFDYLILPSIRTSMTSLNLENLHLISVSLFLRLFYYSYILLILVLKVLAVYLKNPYHAYVFYKKAYLLNRKNSIVLWLSLYFSVFYRFLESENRSTRFIMESLCETKGILHYLSRDSIKQLDEGISFERIVENWMMDQYLIQLFETGTKTGELETLLDRYREISEKILIQKIDVFTQRLSVFVYVVCSVIIILLYRLLLFPLKMIENL